MTRPTAPDLQLCVTRSGWKGHVTMLKGGRCCRTRHLEDRRRTRLLRHRGRTSDRPDITRGWKTLHLGVDRAGVIVAQALTEATVDDATVGIELIWGYGGQPSRAARGDAACQP
jgi:hypothetical protein